jgi:endogenous inhibitor of DNA gyrase (YacG/DUF329 family)
MATAVVCVNCRARPVDPKWRPFCSERCKWADLSRWLNGDYRVPGEPAEAPVESAGAEDDAPE